MNRRKFLNTSQQAALALTLGGCASSGVQPRDVVDLTQADAVSLLQLISQGGASSLEVLEACIARCEAVNAQINAVVYTDYDKARQQARSNPEGLIGGLPYLIKDLTDVAGMTTTYGSRAFIGNVVEQSSPITQAVADAGGVIFGKTNTPEFGLVATTESLALGPCRNPWHLGHSSGGSSGGAAAAVAGGIIPVAQASDGGGSIRIPASCCGLVGLKPSRGRMVGEVDHTQLSQISVRHAVSRTVRDNALLFAVGEGRNSGLAPVGFVKDPIDRPLRIAFSVASAKGVLPQDDVAEAVKNTAKLCESLGHDVVEVSPQINGAAFEDAFLDLWSSSTVGARDEISKTADKPLDQLLEPWTLYLADHFEKNVGSEGIARAMNVFAATASAMDSFMQNVDVWLTPVLAAPAPAIGQQSPDVPIQTLFDRTFEYVAYTPLANVLGTPAISLPLGMSSSGLPIGNMFMANHGQEALLLQLAYQLERAQPWHALRPKFLAAG